MEMDFCVVFCAIVIEVFLVQVCQVFLGGRTHEQIFLVQKLACLVLEQEAKKKKCGFPVSSYKNLGRVGRF